MMRFGVLIDELHDASKSGSTARTFGKDWGALSVPAARYSEIRLRMLLMIRDSSAPASSIVPA
jgi:hypothetical protein